MFLDQASVYVIIFSGIISGWFEGLSNLFLDCPVPKMLLLAGESLHLISLRIF